MTARRRLLDAYGEEVLARTAARMGASDAQALLDPVTSAWYPEPTFQRAMSAVLTVREYAHDRLVVDVHFAGKGPGSLAPRDR